MSWSERELADLHEGLLDPDVAEALEAELALDEELAARHAALGAVLREPVELPELSPPAGLGAALAARLAETVPDARLAEALEGLADDPEQDPAALLARDPARARALRATLAPSPELEPLPPLAPPAGLLGRVLGRLEQEGLLPAASAEDASSPELSDERLAALAEGVLSPAEAEASERALGRSPAARARLAQLQAVLGDRTPLPALAPPAGLSHAIAERLTEEGLLPLELPEGASLALQPPADLLGKTLGRLEASGLLTPAAQPALPVASAASAEEEAPSRAGVLLRFPALALSAAALLLVGVGLGLWAGPGREAAEGDPRRRLAGLSGELDQLRSELDAERERRERAEGQAQSRRAEAEGLGRDLRAAQERGATADAALSAARERLAAAERDLAGIEGLRAAAAEAAALRETLATRAAELQRTQAELARREGSLDELRARAQSQEAALAQAQASLREQERTLGALRASRQESETQRALALDALEELRRRPGGAPLQVAGVAGVERWDSGAQAWRPIAPGSALAPGEIVRGGSAQSTLQVSGLLPFQLRSGVYVVRDAQRLDPLPVAWEGGGAWEGAQPEPEDVLVWIERLQSGSAVERAQAQRALCARFAALGGRGAPPTTPRAWSRWWSEQGEISNR